MDHEGKEIGHIGVTQTSTPEKPPDPPIPLSERDITNQIKEKGLMTKVDLRLIPILGLIYFLAFLDRVNISNALTLGLPQELGLIGEEVNIALAIFFIPYILFEIPSNWLMKRFKPHVWLSGCVTIFGIFMLAQGFVKSYHTLLVTRFFLGFAEAGIFPGCFYLISFYYKRSEAQRRFTWFWNATGIASAFGSLIASGIATIGRDRDRGISSWRWLFIIEGALTIFFGILSFFAIVDFPKTATWLRDDERELILARIEDERSTVDSHEEITLKGVVSFFGSAKNLLGGVVYFGALVPLYSLSYFAPTIIKGLGLDVVQTQLHTVPIWAAAIVFSLILSYLSDRVRLRSPFLIFSILVSIAGIAILQTVHGRDHFSAQYAALFLVVIGVYTAGPLVICWVTMNLRGHVERSIGTAWMISFGNIGGLVATFTLPAKDAPLYHSGYAICQAAACLAITAILIYLWRCIVANKKASSLSQDLRTLLYML